MFPVKTATKWWVAIGLVMLVAAAGIVTGRAAAQDWPDIFDPLTLINLDLSVLPSDWEIVQYDETFDIEVPAWFWADVILAVPEFHDLYTAILVDLVTGPLNEVNLHAFLNSAETLLTAALEAEPNNQIEGSMSDHFDGARAWVTTQLNRACIELPLVGVEESDPGMAGCFTLAAPPPNPSSTATMIRSAVPEEAHVRLQVYHVMGHLVATLTDEVRSSGQQAVMWQGADQRGHRVPAGGYFAGIEAGSLDFHAEDHPAGTITEGSFRVC